MPDPALWTFGAVGVYVDGKEDGRKNIWAELQVIDDTETTLHWYGAESERVTFRGHLWGKSDVNTLKGYAAASTTRTITGPNSYNEDAKIVSIRARRVPDKTDVTNEFFQVEIEVILV